MLKEKKEVPTSPWGWRNRH